jgi:hypothetical protein
MKLEYVLGIFLTALLLLSNSATSPVAAQAPAGSQLRLLSSGEGAIVLELTVVDFQLETVEGAGQTYQRVIIPGMVQTTTPGEPQVPARGALLGLPAIERVTVQVLEADYDVLRGYRLVPAPALQVIGDDVDAPLGVQFTFALNQERYATDAFYPGRPVEIGQTGYMRDQAVAQVQFYPLQYNPVTGEVRLYRRILARVTWHTPPAVATAEARGASPAYEHLLRNALLNYKALERPAVKPSSQSPFSMHGGGAGTTKVVTTNPSPFSLHEGGLFAASITPTLKIGVTEDGLYELTYSDLTGAGLDLSGVDPRTLKLSHRGVEVPIYVPGEDDGVFDPTDTLLFYGTAITDVYTAQNVYRLTAGGGDGQRMGTRDGTLSGSAPVPPHFPVTRHAEQDTYYWVTMPNGQGQDHWFWGDKLTAPASRDYPLTLHNISTTASTATVRLRLKGHTDTSTNPDHHTRIYLNGVEIDDQLWDGFSIYDHHTTVPHSYLNEGSNTVRVEGVGDTGAAVDQFFLNWIEIDYWDTYVAESDELLFGAPAAGTFQFEVTGFGGDGVAVFDVTDPAGVMRITDTTVVADGGGYKLQFEDTAQPETRYLALRPARHKSPASLELDEPSSWRSPGNGADYILITHEDFYASALRLADHRSALGLRVVTVKVGDIYDEFNHGVFNPQAMRDFLAYAYDHWAAPAPTHVLLVGGASYDYRDLLDLDRANYVPTQIIETDLLGQTPSDNWFVLVSGADILPDMFIGRLTAQNPSEADDMVDKVIHYEQNLPDGSWNTQVLLVADDESSFETISERLAGRLPFYYTANRVYAGDYPPGDPTTDVTNYINGGSVLVNYTGHGNVDRWGSWSGGRIFDRADVTALNNTHKLPVVTIASCLNGYFAGKNVSLAEEFLLRDDRGAAAVWADSGLGYPSGHRVLMGEFYEAIFQDDQYGLGAATTAAKIATYAQSSFWGELVETFVLFGDPAMPLGIPTNYPYLESTTPADGASDVPVDQDLQIVFSKPMSPATVLLGGEGTTSLTFTPTWSADNTVLSYAHPNFDYGQTLTFTISGQDELGNPLGLGLVPSTWSFATTPPVGVETVAIAGPARGAINTPYTFSAAVSPITASLPITYVWQATGQAPVAHTGGLSDMVTFTWHTLGTQVITVTATNVGGTVTGTHVVTILPVAVAIAGPTAGVINTPYTFEATVSPTTATLPITYAWQATGQAPLTHTGGLSDTVIFTWRTPGMQAITATTTNAEGVVSDTHLVTINAPPTSVTIAGPVTGMVNIPYTCTATTGPITATLPITYVWQATGQSPRTHVGGLSDTITFTWSTSATQTIAVTAMNGGGTVADTHVVTINDVLPTTGTCSIYLPLVIRSD